MASPTLPNGRPSMPPNAGQAPFVPNWNPASLLNPRGASSAATPLPRTLPPNNLPTDPAVSNGSDPISFQFTNTYDDGPHHGENFGAFQNGHPTQQEHNGIGMSNMLDRAYNLENRNQVPVAKRRKIDVATEDVPQKKQQFGSGSSGLLASHLKAAPGTNGIPMMKVRAETVDLTEPEDDDLIIVEKPKEEDVCYGMVEAAKLNCHIVPTPKPGVKSLGGSSFWPPIKVVQKRQDGDNTATIPVFDHTRTHIGRIDSTTSKALCPLLDSPGVHLRTDMRLKARPRKANEVTGEVTSLGLQIELTLYGPLKHAKGVGRILSEKGVHLVAPLRVDPGYRVVNPHAPAAGLTTAPQAAKFRLQQQHQLQPQQVASHQPAFTRTVEEIRSEVIGIFDTMAKAKDLPEMEPDARIITPLLKHQKQALSFMTAREIPSSEKDDSAHATSIWQKRPGQMGDYYYNVITAERQRTAPADTLGGILADVMGLGKTLSILSLVATTLDKAQVWHGLDPVQPHQPPEPKKSNAAARGMLPPAAPRLDLTKVKRNGKATLLVCPLSTITNWEEQIKQHVQGQTLNYHIYHGANRRRDVSYLSACDLVITTYGSISSEVNQRKKNKEGLFPLEEISWFRIVLDEAHMIREQSTLLFKAICRLQASRRWAVTGTPVQNKLEDLGSLLAFLRLQPFDHRTKFATHILAPFKSCDPEIIPKIRILVDTITLRRLKDRIDLPKKTDMVIRLQFSEDERRLYNVYEQSAKERVQVLTNHQEKSIGRSTYIHVLQAICRLRKICCHGKDLLNDEDLQILKGTQDAPIDLDDEEEEGDGSVALSEAKAYEIFGLMLNTGRDTCDGCQRKLGSIESDNAESEKQEEKQEDLLGYMTKCLSLYCPTCIGTFQDEDCGLTHTSNKTGRCPICNDLHNFLCRELRRSKADEEHDELSGANAAPNIVREYTGPHTKVHHLLGELADARRISETMPDERPIKSVVFSQWTSNLDLIEKALNSEGYTYTRLDGKMSRGARTFAMDAFRENDAVTVILVSITAGGLGLNLTAASNVFVMEPQFNPAAEAQAVDRVHRLGQKREVRCVRYIMQDSFEEKMQDLQSRKTKLANLSMDKKDRLDKADQAKKRLDELRSLFK